MTGLTKCTRYYFRIEATNSVGTSVGAVKNFGSDCEPAVETQDATAIGATVAQLNSRINPGGRATTYHYEYRVRGSTGAFTSTSGLSLPDRHKRLRPQRRADLRLGEARRRTSSASSR